MLAFFMLYKFYIQTGNDKYMLAASSEEGGKKKKKRKDISELKKEVDLVRKLFYIFFTVYYISHLYLKQYIKICYMITKI